MDNVNSRGKQVRYSKNRKKGWKKTNIHDVLEHLEDQRLQERTGGLVAEKKNEELFFIDTAEQTADSQLSKPVSRKTRKQPKPLRSHALLEPDPAIKPLKLKRNVKGDSLKKRCTAVQNKLSQGVLSITQKKALVNSQKYRNERSLRLKAKRDLPTTSYDLWSSEHTSTNGTIPRVCTTRKKPSGLPAVEVPAPGASYNPTYEDHQALLQEALDLEEKKLKDEEKIKRALDEKFPKASEAPTQETWLSEMSAGLHPDGETAAGERNEDDVHEESHKLSSNAPVRREDKKTERERKRERDRKLKEKRLQQMKSAKLKKQEIYRLKKIKLAVKERERELKERAARKEKRKEQTENAPKKLGKQKYEDPSIEIKLSNELEGCMRLLKPEGNLLEDRYKSLQKRNIIETRNRKKKTRKYKQKSYEKKGHRNISA